MSGQGYYGTNYDRYIERNDSSTLHKMKETYWTTKQAVIKKLGKKEDEHVVASDSLLDAKLEVFQAIQKSSMELLRVIEKYQDRLCALSQEENAFGRFLKSQSGIDKTRAGKMMAAVGKSQSFAAQQRLALRVPLVRLYQEVETFRYRAISDTLMTINRMEGARTEYRGALLWMKAVSEELDPDTYKQLEKFRKVQAQVRKTKARFDKLKLDVMQKVDLLAASRCNMFSHVLANYQSTLLHFWEKTSRTMTAVSESFRGYQHYDFSMLKELAEPSKKLIEQTTNNRQKPERDTDNSEEIGSENSQEELDLEDKPFGPEEDRESWKSSEDERLLVLEDEAEEAKEKTDVEKNGSLQNLYEGDNKSDTDKETLDLTIKNQNPFIDFGEEGLNKKLTDDDFSALIPNTDNKLSSQGTEDLLRENIEPDDSNKDDLAFLNEILNAPSTGEDEFTREWQAVFGDASSSGSSFTPVESDQPQKTAEFMPSNLLDLKRLQQSQSRPMSTPTPGSVATGQFHGGCSSTGTSQQKPKQGHKKNQQADMSAWFNLFADLDPLANPDAIGKKGDEMTDA